VLPHLVSCPCCRTLRVGKMLYICQGIASIFQLPGYLCSAIGAGCKQCPGACATCGRFFSRFGANFKQYFERPLSMYAILSIFLSLWVFNNARSDMAKPEGCTSMFLNMVMGSAVLNIIFPIYLCYKVWQQIMTNEADFTDGDAPVEQEQSLLKQGVSVAKSKAGKDEESREPTLEAPKPGYRIVSSKIVVDAFTHVWMNDFFVLFMFALFCGLLALSVVGQEKIETPSLKVLGNETATEPLICPASDATVSCGYYFFGFAALWSLAWMKCGCCSREVYLKKDIQEEMMDANVE